MMPDIATKMKSLEQKVQRWLDLHVPNPLTQKWIWFALLWISGLLAIGSFGYLLHGILALGY